jgi:hypothetical protein
VRQLRLQRGPDLVFVPDRQGQSVEIIGILDPIGDHAVMDRLFQRSFLGRAE